MNPRVALIGCLVAMLIACEKNSEIKVYRVSKAPLEEAGPDQQAAMPANAPSPSMPGGMGPGTATRDSSAAKIKWTKPETWTEVPPSSMRYASFAAGTTENKVDVSIVTFSGEGGGDADNVNRWRQQIGLPPMTPADVATQIASLKSEDGAFSVIDIAGPNARTVAAWIRREGQVWFFKATGPGAAIEKEKPNFIKFIQSVRF